MPQDVHGNVHSANVDVTEYVDIQADINVPYIAMSLHTCGNTMNQKEFGIKEKLDCYEGTK